MGLKTYPIFLLLPQISHVFVLVTEESRRGRLWWPWGLGGHNLAEKKLFVLMWCVRRTIGSILFPLYSGM